MEVSSVKPSTRTSIFTACSLKMTAVLSADSRSVPPPREQQSSRRAEQREDDTFSQQLPDDAPA